MLIATTLAAVVFIVMFIMSAMDKLTRHAAMGMSAVGTVLLVFGIFTGISGDDTGLLAKIVAVLIFVVMFVLIIMDKIERHIDPLLRTCDPCPGVRNLHEGYECHLADAQHRQHIHPGLLVRGF